MLSWRLCYLIVKVPLKLPGVCNTVFIKKHPSQAPSNTEPKHTGTPQPRSANIIFAMDYSYFSAPQPPYHQFMGMSSHAFAHSGVEHDTIRSVVSIPGVLFSDWRPALQPCAP